MKSKKLLAIVLATILTVGLISCKNIDSNSSSENNTNQNESLSNNDKNTNCNDLIALIGKSSDDVKKIFGDGEENIYEKDLIGIYYADEEILGEKATIDLAFDTDSNKVLTVSIAFKNENEETYKKVYETLTNDLGEPTSKEEGGEDTQYKETWKKDNSTINIIKMGKVTNINIE